MSIDRLTQKAQEVLKTLINQDQPTAKKLLKYITQADGMGRHLIESVPPITIKKTQLIDTEKLLKEAYFQAIRLEHSYVGTEHLYLALLRLQKSRHLSQAKVELIRRGIFPTSVKIPLESDRRTPLLDTFGSDLNHEALKDYAFSIVDREEYADLISTLLLKEKSNVLLVGDPGVGKRTIVKLLAYNLNSLEVPPALVGYSLRSLNVLSFMTSIANKGGFELGIATLIDELKSLNKVILVLENFQDIFLATPAGLTIPLFYSILKSYFEQASVNIITYLTPGMYEKISTENEHIIDNFTVVDVDEPSVEEVKNILKANAKRFEDFHNVQITNDILEHIYKVSNKEIKSVKFPQKALDLLDYACAYTIAKKSKIPESYKVLVDETFNLARQLDEDLEDLKYDRALRTKDKIVKLESNLDKKEKKIFSTRKTIILTKKDVDSVLEHFDMAEEVSTDVKGISRFGKLAAKVKKEIIGQDAAIDVVTKALVRSKLGLRSKKRPLGNFLFLGPTGVGKTELAKILAKHGFSKESWSGLIRLDMSDFSEKHTVARLVGAPPGYIGYGEGGELTSKIDAHPTSVVLFDEIEKAHPDVLNILLQIMEEGELADARGNTFDFSKAVVILTSNLGTEILHNKGIGFDERDIKDKDLESRLKGNLKGILKPELLNRFDEIIVFKRLSKVEQLKIVNLLLKEVIETLSMQNVDLKVLLTVKKWLLNKGYSKEYGARALRRTIEKELLDKVAKVLLENDDRPLRLRVVVDVSGGLEIKKIGTTPKKKLKQVKTPNKTLNKETE
ncbi:MAG: ATP-dependent Clp protease ATP-binding subunit [Paludibacteraceae bacterium]|nr:ATP-dependent Clp protease ATP-binding subunit [Paludibacteraceae bacterium]